MHVDDFGAKKVTKMLLGQISCWMLIYSRQ